MDEQETSSIQWQEILALLLRRWMLIAAIGAIGLVVTVFVAFSQGPMYEASAKLMVSPERARITVSPDPSTGATVDRITDQELNSEVALLKSPALVREVLEPYRDKMKWQPPSGFVQRARATLNYWLDLPGRLYRSIYNVPPTSMFDNYVETIGDHVSVTPIKMSNLIQITFAGPDPVWTAEFVNQLAAHHVERRARLNQQSEALPFLEQQRQLLSDKMRQAEQTLDDFYTREGVHVSSDERTTMRTRLTELETALANSNTELAEAAARAEFLSHELKSPPSGAAAQPRAAQGDPLQLVRNKILDLQLQRSEALSRFAPTSLKVQEFDRQIGEAKRLLAEQEKAGQGGDPALVRDLSQTQAQTAAVKARVESLRTQIATSRAKIDHLDEIASEQGRLEQAVTTAKESLLTYTKKVEAARFTDALDQSRIVNVSVVEKAELPASRRSGQRGKTIMMGAMMSLGIGAGLAFLRDRIDPKVKSAAEAERASGLPILADIPS